ncbi:hypothetical protein BH20ACT22_BH20ACT22_22020 [soil metagenome]
MDTQTRDKISATQRQNWESRRAVGEQLEALRESHRRALETLDLCAAYVDYRATEEGDPFATFLQQRVDTAFDGMKVESIAASTLIADTPQPDTGNATG